LNTLSECSNNLEKLLDTPDYFLHIYGFFLLAQFKEPLAYPLIVEFFSNPGDISLDVTGDFVTEDLDRILASVSQGNIDLIQQLIENEEVNEYVRSAALKSLVVLVITGVISRETVIEYHRELFLAKLERKHSLAWNKLVITTSMLCPVELKAYIDQAYEDGLVETFWIRQKDVNSYLEKGIEACLDELRNQQSYSLITDTISELKSWPCFRKKKEIVESTNFSIIPGVGFNPSSRKAKGQVDKKKKIQEQSRRKNRHHKK
jgi:hypothetical protein